MLKKVTEAKRLVIDVQQNDLFIFTFMRDDTLVIACKCKFTLCVIIFIFFEKKKRMNKQSCLDLKPK